jgi:hypothetical protein
MPCDRLLHDPDALVECAGDLLPALLANERVGAAELDERDRDRPVLGLAVRAQEVGADRLRQTVLDREVRDVAHGRRMQLRRRRQAAQQEAGLLLLPDVSGRERGGRRGRDDDLAGVGDRLERGRLRRGLAGDQELAVALADEEEVERAGVDPDRHPQHDRPRLGPDPADGA